MPEPFSKRKVKKVPCLNRSEVFYSHMAAMWIYDCTCAKDPCEEGCSLICAHTSLSITQASKSCVDQPTCEPISLLAIGNYSQLCSSSLASNASSPGFTW